MVSIKTMTGKPRYNRKTGRALAPLKSYKVRWYYPLPDGKAEEQTVTWRNADEARMLRAAIEQRGGRVRKTDADVLDRSIVTGKRTRVDVPTGPTVPEVVDEFIARKIENGLKANTIATYRSANRAGVLRHVWPNEPVAHLDETKIREFVAHLQSVGMDHRAPMQFLRSVLLFAMAKGYVATNPLTLVTLPSVPKYHPRYISQEEFLRILAPVPRDDEFRLLLVTAWETGLREGELCALQRDDVITINGKSHITVNHTVAQGKDGKLILTTPKSGKSRDVPISARLADQLLAPGRHSQRIFPAKHNPKKSLRPQYATKRFALLRKEAKLSGRMPRFHDLRHSYASNLFDNGVDVYVVSKVLGHASINITVDIYYDKLGRKAEDSVRAAIAGHAVD